MIEPQPRKHIPSIAAYPPGKPIEEVQREFGLDSVVKLASNENPLGPSPKAVRAMRACAGEMHLYPDGAAWHLKHALAGKFGVQPEQICLGNGSDELTDLVALAYLGPRDDVVLSRHDFISYRLAAMMIGASVREVPLKDWRCDLEGLAAAIGAKTKIVWIANPSNPVGTMVERKDFEAFMKKVPPHVLVFFDQAYFEYVDDPKYPDGVQYLKRYPNLIVARTFSKAYGLAGLRVGYGFAHPEVVENLNRVRPPFNVTRMAQKAALAALEDEAHVRKAVEVNETGRAFLQDLFRNLDLAWVPSVTNFLLVDVRRSGAEVAQALMSKGVVVRPMGGYGLPAHVRVSIGRPGENRRFASALKQTLKEIPAAS